MRRAEMTHGERGAAAVMVLLSIPLFLLFVAFVVNFARWWVVDRHMQIQADAAALAAGTELGSDPLHCTATRVERRAQQYAGISAAVGDEAPARYNGAEVVHTPAGDYEPNFRFNSADYAIGGTSDPDAASFTGAKADPCVSGIADVKLTTTDVPWVLKAIDVTPDVNAHARVQLLKAGAPTNAVPFGVETADPKRVYAEFVDLASGATVSVHAGDGSVVSGFDLEKDPISNGLIPWSSAGQYSLQTSSPGRIGLRLRISDSSGTVDCSANDSVDCYGTGLVGSEQNSLDTVRFFDDPDAADAFGVRLGALTVTPSSADCDPALQETGAFHTTCTKVSVAAHIVGLDTDKTVVVKANGTTLTYDGAVASDPRWTGEIGVNIGSGANEITIDWSQKGGSITASGGATTTCTNKNPCTGTFTNAHRSFEAEFANAGPITHITTVVGAGSYAAAGNVLAGSCSAASPCPVSVTAELGGSVSLAKPTDDPIALRLTGSGSLTGLLDCDPDTTNTEQEVAVGCGNARYTENTGEPCESLYANVNQLFSHPERMPWPCVGSEQGERVPKVPEGITARILCPDDPLSCLSGPAPACTAPNNWPNFDPEDPRIIPVFLVPIGSSAQNGSSVYRILTFAAFYVTGWSKSPCTGADNEIPDQYVADHASVFGHWIKYIPPNLSGGSSPCDLSSIEICTPVLVK